MKKGTRGSENKSQMVRDYASKNPTATGPAIVKALGENGVKVSLPLVYQAMKKNGSEPKAKRGRKPGSKNKVVTSAASASGSLLDAALALIKGAGSFEKAIETLTILKKLG